MTRDDFEAVRVLALASWDNRRTVRKDDRCWLAILAIAMVLGVAASWQRWASPVIDSGREMNQPLRLAGGEMLYSDVRHIYGPLSPYLHAGLFRLFGPALSVLYADGVVSAVVILALVYVLARRVMDARAAGTAALTVMWLCAFKPAGNYFFPYSFNALHGTLLGLATLNVAAGGVARPSAARFAAIGCLAGAAVLAKTEMGLAALAAGVAAAWLSSAATFQRRTGYALIVAASAAVVAGSVYAGFAARVGWHTLAYDSWLLPVRLPEPLVYYNAALAGVDHPLASLARMIAAAVKLTIIAAIVAAVSHLAAGPADGRRRARTILGAAVATAIVLSLTTGLDWDRGPFLAMPLVLLALLVRLAGRPPSVVNRLVILYAVFALAQLARMIFHVRSGGAYGSFLLPMSVVIFTYVWVGPFAEAMPDIPTRRVARSLALWLLLVSAAGTAVVLVYRYRRANTVPISTARGTLVAPPDIAAAWNGALAYLEAHTKPGDPVAVLPEGTTLDFLGGRRNPLREEIATPGYLDDAGEARAIEALDGSNTRLILIVNRATREFGAESFGRDYCQRLMQWIDARYVACAMFGAQDPALRVGDKPFFVRAYCRR